MFQHLRQEKDEEIRCNTEIEQFLRTHQQELERKVWLYIDVFRRLT